MSDTPKTDAFEALVNRPTNWWDFARELERENAALRELAARMATEMRETDHEFASLQDYDARKEAQP